MHALFAENVELTIPGNSSLAATYKGRDAVLGFGGKNFNSLAIPLVLSQNTLRVMKIL